MRIAAVVAALAAAFVSAPAAFGATFVVKSSATTNDLSAQGACTTQGDACTLPAAIQTSNDSPGADRITFSGAGTSPGPFSAPLPDVNGSVEIDGGGNTTVAFTGGAGPLLNIQAPDTTLRAITITGGGSGIAVNLAGSRDRLDAVTVRDVPGVAVNLDGAGERVDGSVIQRAGGDGIAVPGSSATIASTTITGSGGSGLVVSGSGANISGGQIDHNAGNGVTISGQNVVVSRVVFFANGGQPVALAKAAGANGGTPPPQNLRIGPRRADGTLPLTGTGSGTVELWSGDPSGAGAPSFVDAFGVQGDFAYNFPSDPEPGSVYAASLTSGAGSSEFAAVAVPADTRSPDVAFARALDTSNVRVDFTEPVDPASVQASDFKLTMAGADRAIAGAAPSPDGRFVTLTASGWRAGEAGYVEITGVGAFADPSGNAMLSAPRLRVAAAPGDFVAPLGARLAVTPRTICLTHARNCRKPGMTIKFISSEQGKARLLVKRGDKTIGSRLYSGIIAGRNTLKFNGRLGSRKLRAGRYRLLMYVQDQVGNITDQPPIVLFTVRRVTK
jgi:hypothetical protein